jgi:hypothetical protein
LPDLLEHVLKRGANIEAFNRPQTRPGILFNEETTVTPGVGCTQFEEPIFRRFSTKFSLEPAASRTIEW